MDRLIQVILATISADPKLNMIFLEKMQKLGAGTHPGSGAYAHADADRQVPTLKTHAAGIAEVIKHAGIGVKVGSAMEEAQAIAQQLDAMQELLNQSADERPPLFSP